jgi:osmoprotectant transport system ATP-binding protein
MIRLEAVSKKYDDGTDAVHALSLEVRRGELAVLVGPSGCGKTTTMKMINRLVEPTGGRVLLDGDDVAQLDPVQLRRRVGYVIQQVGLFPHQTIRGNVGTVPSLLGWDRGRTRKRADELLDLVGLDPGTYGDRYPSQLSGGQRQRVGVARALAADPLVLLMDEPFSAVDPVARERLQTEFLRLQRSLGTTVVLVTHDVDEAVRLGDRIAVMKQGGHLEQYADPATLLGAPASEFVADFVGADRAVKRLAVTGIDRAMLVPFAGEVDAEVRDDADLGAVLSLLLTSQQGRVAVVDAGGTRLGTVTPSALHAAVQAAAVPAAAVPAVADAVPAVADAEATQE